ncbi:MAG: tRNA(Ile)-lysidine synthase [Bacteroidota bacterium]
MLQQFQNHFTQAFPSVQGKKVLVAVSGGIDSMVLLDLFQKLGVQTAVLHYNFQLRDRESDEDQRFISEYCKARSIAFFTKNTDTQQYAMDHKLSIQLAARQLRYEWFYEQLASLHYDFIATAHHLDDSVETFFINLTRGTGLNGLLGIPAQNDNIIRPLLPFSRDMIQNYAVQNQISWREDASNKTTKYLRNKFRHDFIPIIKEIQPDFLLNFQHTIQHLQDSQSIVKDAMQHFKEKVIIEKEGKIYFDCTAILLFSNYKSYLYQMLSLYGFTAWEDVYSLITKPSGKQILSENFVLLKDRKCLILYPKIDPSEESYLIESKDDIVKIPLNIVFCNTDDILIPAPNRIFVDENKLQFPLQIRKWKEGDFFYPFGMVGKKKISKFFKDEKLSLIEKNNTWLLCSNEQIVWVIGMRMDDRFKVTNETQTILKITVEQ